ncbi:MAG: hypothetical protein HY890_04010 [Deltaproteobacteria bacterium]|nr:hypothetical protein [Deltaproteobacteria bacterium]
MKKKNFIVFIIAFFFLASNSFGEAPKEYKIKPSLLNPELAKRNLDRIEDALHDFRDFTDLLLKDETLEKLDKKGTATVLIDNEDIKKIQNLNWKSQNYGFHNWEGDVRATLLKMNYELKKYEYELAKCKQVSPKDLDRLEKEINSAREEFEHFIANFSYAD